MGFEDLKEPVDPEQAAIVINRPEWNDPGTYEPVQEDKQLSDEMAVKPIEIQVSKNQLKVGDRIKVKSIKDLSSLQADIAKQGGLLYGQWVTIQAVYNNVVCVAEGLNPYLFFHILDFTTLNK